jgi:uncharacterized membrane protein YqhA
MFREIAVLIFVLGVFYVIGNYSIPVIKYNEDALMNLFVFVCETGFTIMVGALVIILALSPISFFITPLNEEQRKIQTAISKYMQNSSQRKEFSDYLRNYGNDRHWLIVAEEFLAKKQFD